MSESDLNRRELIAGMLSVGGQMVGPQAGAAQTQGRTERMHTFESDTGPIHSVNVTLEINGQQHHLEQLDVRTTLLDCLRDNLHLTGSKKGCGLGHCGACTVLIDGRRVTSCLTLAVMQQGRKILTIEGLATGDTLHPVQAAFIDHDGYQCGYCTPGQIMSAVACIAEGHTETDDDIREWMSGNICRCGAYPYIVAAVRDAAGRRA
jgi:xanthine dehydrogenase YagT iron-sulfur-binding subunit